MTTPERHRNRQRLLGIGMIVLGLATVYNSRADALQGDEFRTCISEQVTALTTSLRAQDNLNDADRKATRKVILTVHDTNDREAFRAALGEYARVQDEISRQLEEHPIPPFPNGKCR